MPKSGIAGILGINEEKCFSLNIPAQTIDKGISGGGTQKYFISESELESNNKIIITPTNFDSPKKIEDIQINYNRIDTEDLLIDFK